MPKLIFDGDRLAAAVIENDDITTVAACLRYALAEMKAQGLSDAWRDRPHVERILRDLTTTAPDEGRPA